MIDGCAMTTVKEMEERINKIWGPSQFDWTIGKCPQGWFYYCGSMSTPTEANTWKHGGYEPTLEKVLQKIIDMEDEPSNRLTPEAKLVMELEEGNL